MLIIKSIYFVFKREIKLILHNRLYFTTLLVLPIVMVLLFMLMFARGSVDGLPIAVVDNDNSTMSRKLISMMQSTRSIGDITTCYSVLDANAMLRRGEVRAVVVVPDNFERDIVAGVSTSVVTSISASNLSTAGVLQREIQQVVQSFSAGVAVSRMESIGYAESQAIADVMPINILMHTISNPYMNYGYYLAPMFMFVGVVLFVVLMTIYAIGRELRYATAPEWMATSSNSLAIAIVGKLLPITIVMIVVMGLVYVALFIVMGMELMCSWPMLGFSSLLLILAYQSIAVVIIALTANLRLALSLGGGYAVMAFTFSGVTFPTISMYGIVQIFAKLFPLTLFSDIFTMQALCGAGVQYSIDELGYLVLFVLFGVVAWRRLGKIVRIDKYWNRD